MRLIISDSSCLIDLRKASLLEVFLRLPYEILIPDTLFEEELIKFTPGQKAALIAGGLRVIELPSEGVLRAQAIARDLPQLSVQDAFVFALAEANDDSILLTGDGALRALATKSGREVHGVLWVIDELHASGLVSGGDLLAVLRRFAADSSVRLPRRELAAQIKRYASAE